jgi:hypothetical protein
MAKQTMPINGIRINGDAGGTIRQWTRLTGRSVNWLTSWCITSLRTCMISAAHADTAKHELEAMGRVQTELMLSQKRVAKAKNELATMRKSK